jgi:hypothetical protein
MPTALSPVGLSCPTSTFSCPALKISRDVGIARENVVEVRGFEPLTSGLQSPRSAKLSYTPMKR